MVASTKRDAIIEYIKECYTGASVEEVAKEVGASESYTYQVLTHDAEGVYRRKGSNGWIYFPIDAEDNSEQLSFEPEEVANLKRQVEHYHAKWGDIQQVVEHIEDDESVRRIVRAILYL